MSHQRLDIHGTDPEAHKAVLALEKYVRSSGLDPTILELIKIRSSQLNGCAFCLDMHTRDAARQGETAKRMNVLAAWREAPHLYSERERAALALTEQVTLVSNGGVSDEVWNDAAEQFGDKELVNLLMAIATINVWNRLAVATHQDLLPDD